MLAFFHREAAGRDVVGGRGPAQRDVAKYAPDASAAGGHLAARDAH